MASNPVLRGFEKTGRPGLGPQQTQTMPSVDQMNQWYAQSSAQPHGQAYAQPGFPPQAPPQAPARYLTLDDVITRSVVMLATILLAGAFAWFVIPDTSAGLIAILAGLGAFVLALVMAFRGRASAATAVPYAALEGLFLGTITEVFDRAFPGIAIQAVTGTIMVAGGVLVVYKAGRVRVTPKFYKIVFASTLGVVGLMFVNLIASFFHAGGLGLRDGGSIAILFSLACIVIGAMNLIVDFDMIEQSVRRGVPEQFGWYLAFGLMVTLVWLYLEILRLLSYLRDN